MFAESFLGLAALLTMQEAKIPAQEPALVRSLPVARYVPGPQPPVKKDQDSFGVETSARGALVMDVASGQTLYEKDAEVAYPIASLTKLMTAMTLLDLGADLQEPVTILPTDDPKEGRVVFPEGEVLTHEELLRSLLVGSVNTAGNALARVSGGQPGFVASMNRKARQLGMAQAHFVDPTGLDSRNQASAHDVAIALRAALRYPAIRDISKTEKVELRGRASGQAYLIKSTNLLLDSFLNQAPYRIVAGKTGSLREAGFCLAQATQDQDGHEIIAVVLGSDNHFARFQDAKALTAWSFQTFTWPKKSARP